MVETYRASLVIADSDIDNYFLVVCEEHENIKLGLDLSKDHFLKKPQIDDTIHVLKNFKKLCDMYDVSRTIAICNFGAESKPKNHIASLMKFSQTVVSDLRLCLQMTKMLQFIQA